MTTIKISTQGENYEKYHKGCDNFEKQIEDYRCRTYEKLKHGSVCLEVHTLLNVSVPDD